MLTSLHPADLSSPLALGNAGMAAKQSNAAGFADLLQQNTAPRLAPFSRAANPLPTPITAPRPPEPPRPALAAAMAPRPAMEPAKAPRPATDATKIPARTPDQTGNPTAKAATARNDGAAGPRGNAPKAANGQPDEPTPDEATDEASTATIDGDAANTDAPTARAPRRARPGWPPAPTDTALDPLLPIVNPTAMAELAVLSPDERSASTDDDAALLDGQAATGGTGDPLTALSASWTRSAESELSVQAASSIRLTPSDQSPVAASIATASVDTAANSADVLRTTGVPDTASALQVNGRFALQRPLTNDHSTAVDKFQLDGRTATDASGPARLAGHADPRDSGPGAAAIDAALRPPTDGRSGADGVALVEASGATTKTRLGADSERGLASLPGAATGLQQAVALVPARGASPAATEGRIAAPVGSAGFAPALGLQISALARDGVQEARLQLNPAELGPIHIRIALEGQAARVDFMADVAQTRQAIESSLPHLASALRDAGLTLAGGGVFQQPQDRPGDGQQAANGNARGAASGQAGATNGRDGELGDAGDALRAHRPLAAPRGLVDLLA